MAVQVNCINWKECTGELQRYGASRPVSRVSRVSGRITGGLAPYFKIRRLCRWQQAVTITVKRYGASRPASHVSRSNLRAGPCRNAEIRIVFRNMSNGEEKHDEA